MTDIGKILIIFGIVIVLTGIFLSFSGRFTSLGKLPGDVLVQKGNFTFYFPIVTSIIISIVLSLVFWIFRR